MTRSQQQLVDVRHRAMFDQDRAPRPRSANC